MDLQSGNAKVASALAAVQVWVPIGNHRWWIAVGVALVLGFILRGCF
jgi:hypothetical protein